MSSNKILSKDNLYGGIKILSPDGAILCRCNDKKANWYLSRKLADRKADDCVVLRFNPKGPGDTYSTVSKENICVVCGSSEELTKHHIIPRSYRHYFPPHFKSHLSHDCVLLCVGCHEKYEEESKIRQVALANEHGIPEPGKEKDHRYGKDGLIAFSSIAALLNAKNNIPARRKHELWGKVERFFKRRPTREELKKLLDEGTKVKSHGELLVSSIPEEKLVKFIVDWRKHFLKVMRPGFLPRGWAVSYRTHYTGNEFELFKAYEDQVKAFQEGVSDARAMLPRKDLSSAQHWVKEAYDTGYTLTEKETRNGHNPA